jgi:hypothetical protein
MRGVGFDLKSRAKFMVRGEGSGKIKALGEMFSANHLSIRAPRKLWADAVWARFIFHLGSWSFLSAMDYRNCLYLLEKER